MRWHSYHTNSTYEAECRRSAAEFAAHGLRVHVTALPDVGDWMSNCLARSIHLNSVAHEHPFDAVGLLDADLVVQHCPTALLEPFDGDILLTDLGPNVPIGRRYSAGIVAFNATEGGRKALAYWANECQRDERKEQGLREQFYLYRTIEQLRPRLSILPPGYNAIPWGIDASMMPVIHV